MKHYTIKDIVNIDCINNMKHNIKVLGQKRTLDIINGGHLVLTDKQRVIYRKLYFQALHEMEGYYEK